MRLIPPLRKKAPRTVYVGSHEDRLSRLPALRIDPDDDGRTREDVQLQKAERRPTNLTRGFMS